MFEIDQNKRVDSDLWKIVANYKVLHFDDYPILFVGTNEYGNKIIGSLAAEKDDDDVFRYFQSIVSNKVYANFIDQQISYLEVLRSSKNIFVIDKDINDHTLKAYLIGFEEIPNDYRPLPESICPDPRWQLGFEFSVSLNGAIADLHEAYTKSVKAVTDSYVGFLNQATNSLRQLNLKTEIHHAAYTTGSFKINLKLKLVKFPNIFIHPEEISNYLASFINYSIRQLPSEAEAISEDRYSDESGFVHLEKQIRTLYDKVAVTQKINTRSELKEDLLKALPKIEKMSEEVGNGFNALELQSNKTKTHDVQQIGFIDKVVSQSITTAIEIFENKSDNVIEDDVDKEYKIIIYNLNTDTRKGNAYIKNDEDEDVLDKPSIMILGDAELSETKYTESLYKNKWILVIARARRVNGKYKRMTIKGEFKK